ncbi:succinate dehydrogenase cytochrome b560 subunit, mitochondrial-like [Euwallacea fornicatus]|uniref:succinate dehydrogenase cytochrome b560 subunit, mitochondrial-like n=1 Tax=Euwallacea fornicatus TaxID=995702 RepID=UPI00338F51CD
MSLIFRLAGNRLGQGHRLLLQDSNRVLNYVRPVTIKCTPAVAPLNESHDDRNARFNRPQSPHLTIYKPQLTAMMSISHRFTGLILTAYTVALSAAAIYLEFPLEFYIEKLKSAEIGAGSIYGLKFLLAFPLTYHFWNGIRHLLWDTGRFLTIREVYITGWTVLAVAIVSAAILSGMS